MSCGGSLSAMMTSVVTNLNKCSAHRLKSLFHKKCMFGHCQAWKWALHCYFFAYNWIGYKLLPTNQEGCNRSKTTDEILLSRRIHWCHETQFLFSFFGMLIFKSRWNCVNKIGLGLVWRALSKSLVPRFWVFWKCLGKSILREARPAGTFWLETCDDWVLAWQLSAK